MSLILSCQCCQGETDSSCQALSDHSVQKPGSLLSGYPQKVTAPAMMGSCVHPGGSQGFSW